MLHLAVFLSFGILVFLAEARLLFLFLWGRIAGRKSLDHCRRHPVIHGLAVLGTLCLLYAAFIEPYWPEITTVRLETEKLHGTTLRLVQISDLHCDPRPRLERRLPALVNSLEPDVILFTGDALNSVEAIGLFRETLKRMRAPLGKFAVRGNGDYRFNVDLFADTGFRELRLDVVELEKDGEKFMLCGVEYFGGRIAWNAVGRLSRDTWNCLLYHTTDLAAFIDDEPIDLYLSGHTHGGQIALPLIGALTRIGEHGEDYKSGLYISGRVPLYVNRGIGMSRFTPRMRFFARPEITLFEIHPAVPHRE